MNIDKFVTDISKNPAKAITYAVLLILTVILIYWLYTKIKSGISSIIDSANTVISNPVEKGNLTYESSWYKTSANQIFNAMNGAGTDESVIHSILLKLRNQDDYNQLNREYGVRKLSRALQSDLDGTLIEHLTDDLSNTSLNNYRTFLRNNYQIEMN